jgi:hypothetical protein
MQASRKPKVDFLLPFLFALFRPSTNWMMPTHIGEGSLLNESIQMLILPRTTPSHTHKIYLIRAFCGTVKLTKLTIINEIKTGGSSQGMKSMRFWDSYKQRLGFFYFLL